MDPAGSMQVVALVILVLLSAFFSGTETAFTSFNKTRMKTLAQEGMTMLVVTHEMKFARQVATRTVFMENGVVVEEGPTKEVFEHPREKRTQEFINHMEMDDF